MQASKISYRWVNDGREAYTKKQASKLRRSSGNRWSPRDARVKTVRQ